jgi:hypothetical protein
MSGLGTFAWTSEAEYGADPGDEYGDECVLRVVRPDLASRTHRWERVLRWYGFRPHIASEVTRTDGDDGVPAASIRPAGASGCVIALDESSAGAARELARQTGRPPAFTAPPGADHFTIAATAGHDPAVVIGLHHHFDAAFIAGLNALPGLVWTVLTAGDAAGLSFVVAKAIASRYRDAISNGLGARGTLIINAMNGSVRSLTGGSRGALEPLQVRHTESLLTSDLDALILCAHGEGAHAQLGAMVLCGLADSQEQLADGRSAEGCRYDSGRLVCKRTPPGVPAASFAELAAERVAFFSCNGFSVAGELYPSDLSVVLGLADGYASSLLTNDRPGLARPIDLEIAASTIHRDRGLAGVWQTENFRAFRADGTRPWILFGDEAPTAAEGRKVAGLRSVPVQCIASESPVWWAEPAQSVAGMVVDDHDVHVLTDSETTLTEISVEDVTREWEKMSALTETLRARTFAVYELRSGIPRLFGETLSRRPEAVSALDDFIDVHQQLADLTTQVMDHLNEAGRQKVLTRQAKLSTDLMTAVAREADRRFAVLARTCLLKGSTERLLAPGRHAIETLSSATCERCRQPLRLREFVAIADVDGGWQVANCPVCGPKEARLSRGPRLQVQIQPVALRDSLIQATVTIEPSERPDTEFGVLVLEMKDKARGENFYEHQALQAADTTVAYDVPIPTTLSSDLHTLRAFWTGSLAFAYRRERVAAIPRPHKAMTR